MSEVLENVHNLNVVKRDSDIPCYYVNGISLGASMYDFQFMCGSNVFDNSNKIVYRRDLCDILMSPQHAKDFHIILGEYIREYENKFGEIKPSGGYVGG